MGDLVHLDAYREARPARAAALRLELPELVDVDAVLANLVPPDVLAQLRAAREEQGS